MKKFTIQIILLLLVIGVGFFLYNSGRGGQRVDIPFLPQGPAFKNLEINSISLKIEIADTKDSRSKGLGGRESLALDSGMLFIFEKADKYPFWMKGLKFPLDFIWIGSDTVLDVLENVPPPTAVQDDASLPIYSSKVDIDKVLEVNAGTVQRLNIKVGDVIQIK